MSFEWNYKPESQEKYQPQIEIGKFSDINGTINYHALNKAIKNNWGDEQNSEVSELIKNKIDINIHNLHQIFNKVEEHSYYNDETLNWLASAYDKDQNIQNQIIQEIVKNKGLEYGDAENLMREFSEMMKSFNEKNDFSSELEGFISNDIINRQQRLDNLKNRISESIKFFNPKDGGIQKVVYLPTNPLEKKESGSGIIVGDTCYIQSELDNKINEVHEFLHSIINPVTEKINLSESDQQAILKLAPDRLKDYEDARSILTEEIIRTYKIGFNENDNPSFVNFKKQLLAANKKDLDNLLAKEKKEKGSSSAGDAEELLNSEELMIKYYNNQARDIFSERIWNFFDDYKKSGSVNFEDYLLENYQQILKD
ncbi:MAG: hypothetical protein WAW11_00830 [Patescibacteria group bacterium]